MIWNRPLSIALLSAAILACGTVALSCGDDDDGPPTSATSALPAAASAILQQVEHRDESGIRNSLSLQSLPCTRATGDGGPPKCQGTESDGTPVAVFEFITCSTAWLREADVDDAVKQLVAIQPSRYAAFRPPVGYRLAGHEYVLLFQGPDPRAPGATRGAAVAIDEGRIVSIWLACGAGDGGATLLPAGQAQFLLQPSP